MLTGFTQVVAKPGMGKELLSMAATMPGASSFVPSALMARLASLSALQHIPGLKSKRTP